MIRIVLPTHLRTLARISGEVELEVRGLLTLGTLLGALETRFPVLRGTTRDAVTLKRRPMVRFFACQEDWSHADPDSPLPEAIANGAEPFLVVGASAGWGFAEFARQVAPVTMPVFAAGIITCLLLERFGWFGYGVPMPQGVRKVLEEHQAEIMQKRSARQRLQVWAQGLAAAALVAALAFHVAEVGLVGLALLVLAATMNGVTDEHRIARAFNEGMPFASLLGGVLRHRRGDPRAAFVSADNQ